MEIKNMRLDFTHKNGFVSSEIDGICHTKTLPYLTVAQAVEGSYSFGINDNTLKNTGNCGFFIAPQDAMQTIIHHNDAVTNRINCRWVFLKITVNNSYSFDKIYDLPNILPEEYKKEMNDIFDILFKTDDIFEEYIYYYKIIKILSLLGNLKLNFENSSIDNALEYIKNNYKQKITINKLAKISNMSESNFFAAFKKHSHFTPISYLNNYRLSLAAEQLIDTEDNISAISSYVGIDDSVYFNKLFKKHYGLSPTQYRNTYKKRK